VRPLTLFTLAALILSLGCPPDRGGLRDDDDAVGDDDAGDDDDAAGIVVESASAECSSNRPAGIGVELLGDGRVAFRHFAFSDGCCPETAVTVAAEGRTLRVAYSLTNDFCDCFCSLDVLFTLAGLDAGVWTLTGPDGQVASFELPQR
jgi:hypothetical protein